MKLWLDDTRDPVQYGARGFTWVKDANKACYLLSLHDVTFASLDHDIGIPDGLFVVKFMETYNIWPVDGVVVHSSNVDAAITMWEILDKHYDSLDYLHKKQLVAQNGPRYLLFC